MQVSVGSLKQRVPTLISAVPVPATNTGSSSPFILKLYLTVAPSPVIVNLLARTPPCASVGSLNLKLRRLPDAAKLPPGMVTE